MITKDELAEAQAYLAALKDFNAPIPQKLLDFGASSAKARRLDEELDAADRRWKRERKLAELAAKEMKQ